MTRSLSSKGDRHHPLTPAEVWTKPSVWHSDKAHWLSLALLVCSCIPLMQQEPWHPRNPPLLGNKLIDYLNHFFGVFFIHSHNQQLAFTRFSISAAYDFLKQIKGFRNLNLPAAGDRQIFTKISQARKGTLSTCSDTDTALVLSQSGWHIWVLTQDEKVCGNLWQD